MAKCVITEDKRKDMYEMFDNKLKGREIAELIGCNESTVWAYKKLWKAERSTKATPVPSEPKPETEVKTGLENSDYAKSYLAGDPAVVHSSFEIKRSVQIRSRKTGILYEMDPTDDQQVLKITLSNGAEIQIELSMFERFVDEGVDVFLELKRGA